MQVFIKFQFEGFHQWSGHNGFLKNLHRHIFYVKMFFEVSHGDRDIEFIELKNKMIAWREENIQMTEDMNVSLSCEQIAALLLTCNLASCCSVEVSEDNENGAIVTRRL